MANALADTQILQAIMQSIVASIPDRELARQLIGETIDGIEQEYLNANPAPDRMALDTFSARCQAMRVVFHIPPHGNTQRKGRIHVVVSRDESE